MLYSIDSNHQTIYQCCHKGKDVKQSLSIIKWADTEKEAIDYLENNGGGVYCNTLHNFQFFVAPIK